MKEKKEKALKITEKTKKDIANWIKYYKTMGLKPKAIRNKIQEKYQKIPVTKEFIRTISYNYLVDAFKY